MSLFWSFDFFCVSEYLFFFAAVVVASAVASVEIVGNDVATIAVVDDDAVDAPTDFVFFCFLLEIRSFC